MTRPDEDGMSVPFRPLACTYCGGKLTVDTETTGRPYLAYEVPESITCDEMGCQAVWEPDGTPRDLPAFVRFPSLYTRPDRMTAAPTEALRDALRVHHPIMRSETGPFSGCRCGEVKLGQDVIAHVVEHLSAAVRMPDVHLMPAGEDGHYHGWDCYCVPPWTDADGVRTYHHRDASYWANR